MAIAFAYTESTNTAVVTGGTSGTPANFADFVTADRAGTATDLLTAVGFGAFSTATARTMTSSLNDSALSNCRQAILANTSPVSGTKIRVTAKAGTSDFVLAGCSIGVSTTGDDFDAAPTRITWDGGSSSTTITANNTKVSDEITFAFDKTKRHLIHSYTEDRHYGITGTTGATIYYKDSAPDDTTTQTVAYSSATYGYVIYSLIEVYVADAVVELTYPIRPVELLAIPVKCIVASKTAEADYIFITGTDAWDTAQTESINVTAGNGTYTSTKRWRTITSLDCSDNSAGGGAAWADGTLAVTQDIWGVIWDKGNGQYQLDCKFICGDGSTPTYFSATAKQVVLKSGIVTGANQQPWDNKPSSTLTLGKLEDASTKKTSLGCSIFSLEATYYHSLFTTGGTIDLYSTQFYSPSHGNACNIGALNAGDPSYIRNAYNCSTGHGASLTAGATADVHNLTNNFSAYGLIVDSSSAVVEGMRGYSLAGSLVITAANTIVSDCGGTHSATAYPAAVINYTTGNVYTRDDTFSPYEVWNIYAGGVTHRQYHCNIEVADKDGILFDDEVTVTCLDKDDTEVFSETTSSGAIAEQWITYKTYSGTSETVATLSPHKFIVAAAGKETLTLDNITVGGPIDWHLELQDAVVYPAETDVLKDVQYGDGGSEYTGSLLPMPTILIDIEGREFKSLSSPLIMEI